MSAVHKVALRTLCGFAGSALAGFVIFDVARAGRPDATGFQATILDPTRVASQSLSVGLIAAFIFALVRTRRIAPCLAVAVGWSALMLGQAIGAGGGVVLVARPLWALSLAAGLFLTALLFDALAKTGFRTGKFLFTAPLIAGSYAAAAPAALAGTPHGSGLLRDVLMFALVGLVIGNGTGFGIEAADFFIGPRPAAPAKADPGNSPAA